MGKPVKDSPEAPPRTRRGIKRRTPKREQKPRQLGITLKGISESLKQPKAGESSKASGSEEKTEVDTMEVAKGLEEFLNTGRTGRRNAIPDIADEKVACVSTAGLPGDMASLSCSDGKAGSRPISSNVDKKSPS